MQLFPIMEKISAGYVTNEFQVIFSCSLVLTSTHSLVRIFIQVFSTSIACVLDRPPGKNTRCVKYAFSSLVCQAKIKYNQLDKKCAQPS